MYPKTVSYLEAFGRRFSGEQVISYLEKLKNLKVLIIGEAIIDEYHFGQSIGKAAKEPIIALRSIKKEMYAGGALAIANHLASFCKEVCLFTMIGKQNPLLGFIKKNLKRNIKTTFIRKKKSPTIVKTRFLESSPLQKLLEFYTINESELDEQQSQAMRAMLRPLLAKHNVVICADFGHGMLDQKTRELIMQKSKFLALTAQVNADNFGYHTISKYPRADFVCVDDRELRLEAKDRTRDSLEIMKDLMRQSDYRYMILTKGEVGCFVGRNKGRTIINVPSLANKHVDRVGAGDAFLSIVSPLLAINTPLEITGLVGNAVGALAIEIIGNKESITKRGLCDFIRNLPI